MTDDRTASSANHHTSDTRDVRELLGLRTTAAAVVVGAFIATFLLLALTTAPTAKSLWAETSAWIVVSAAAVTLIRTAGDPLWCSRSYRSRSTVYYNSGLSPPRPRSTPICVSADGLGGHGSG
ncbi:hypothetical protein [Rhodococcus erythropolis]|uniref:hypothetical protein n=1 Tax=Rhodococcus erythropolis TaxID=1833 RepID=UPI000402327C|nr:hypothetical protein [Rhodococcus erythropolis]MBO8150609.1 hypothetical protein [Rhodococcus erythropolis]